VAKVAIPVNPLLIGINDQIAAAALVRAAHFGHINPPRVFGSSARLGYSSWLLRLGYLPTGAMLIAVPKTPNQFHEKMAVDPMPLLNSFTRQIRCRCPEVDSRQFEHSPLPEFREWRLCIEHRRWRGCLSFRYGATETPEQAGNSCRTNRGG